MRLRTGLCFITFTLFAKVAIAKVPVAVEQTDHMKFKKQTQPPQLVKKSKPHNPWEGTQVSLGLIINTGNTNTSNINAGAVINYSKGQWNDNTQFSAQWGRDSGQLSKEKYYLQNQLNYILNGTKKTKKSYIFGNLTGTIDKFSPYEYQVVAVAGYGRQLISTKKFTLTVQIGPGYRRNVQVATSLLPKKVDNSAVLSGQADLNWKITRSGTLTEEFRYDYGNPYAYMRSVTAFTNKIIHNLAVQISFSLDHYSTIPPGSTRTKETDTTTSLSLVYNF